MVDVTDATAKIGDDVEIFGPNMPVETLANTLQTIPYEVMTSVSPRVKRIYYRE
jgi:alanine racemase